jgi:hypothetical protein
MALLTWATAGICFSYNSWVQVFENKKFKELSGPLLLLLEDLKNHPSPGLRNPKRESYEMRAGVRVPD